MMNLPAEPPAPTYGEPTLVRQRLDQGAFRVLVTDTYQRRCAITGEKALPPPVAQHIRSDAQLPCDLGLRLAALVGQPHRLNLELPREAPSPFPHRHLPPGSPRVLEVSTKAGQDQHTLFDRGYVTVAPDRRFRVSRRLREDFDDGENYMKQQGTEVRLPSRPEDHRGREFPGWHPDVVFRGQVSGSQRLGVGIRRQASGGDVRGRGARRGRLRGAPAGGACGGCL